MVSGENSVTFIIASKKTNYLRIKFNQGDARLMHWKRQNTIERNFKRCE